MKIMKKKFKKGTLFCNEKGPPSLIIPKILANI